mgnify:CR=1 FL=1
MSIWLQNKSEKEPKIVTSTTLVRAILSGFREEEPYGFALVARRIVFLRKIHLREVTILGRFEKQRKESQLVIASLPTMQAGDYELIVFHCPTRQAREQLIARCTRFTWRWSFRWWCRFANVVERARYWVYEEDE